MRSPDGKSGYRPGRTFENELNLRYLSPGAFTVLSPEENGSPPDPPPAPPQFRLSPLARRSKNQSFAIIAEPSNYEPSRSPSPNAGRVSPFRGRGFNSTGSRHASPAPSPPPPPLDNRVTYKPNNSVVRKRSHIPQLKRRNSSFMLSTEDSTDESSSPHHLRRHSLTKPQLSKSLNNISARSESNRRNAVPNRKPGVTPLSPIIGSSPEPSSDTKSQSSPSRIPKSQSSPSSRKPSPSRDHDRASHAKDHYKSTGSLINGRLRVAHRFSRDASPSQNGGKPPISPAKRNYRNVHAKVNSFNAKSKTKVPNNANSTSTNRYKPQGDDKPAAPRRASNTKLQRTESNSNVHKTTSSSSSSSSPSVPTVALKRLPKSNVKSEGMSSKPTSPEKKVIKRTASSRNVNSPKRAVASDTETNSSSGIAVASTAPVTDTPLLRKIESAPKLTDMLPSATTVVSTTTETVTKPLKIEATLDTPVKLTAGTAGGGLTSVAIKPMKETPMYMDEDSQTLLKDHNLAKLTPNAEAVVTLANDASAHTLPQVENTLPSAGDANVVHSANFNGGMLPLPVDGKIGVADGIVASAKPANNLNTHISSIAKTESYNDVTGMVIAKQQPTVLPQEVKPIKILVQEKGDDTDVQSGNVRFPPNTTNGTAQGPGAPSPPSEEDSPVEKPGKCGVLMNKFKDKIRCSCCKRSESAKAIPNIAFVKDDVESEGDRRGCFACFKKKKKMHDVEEIIISSADDEVLAKKTFFERMKCCRSNKVEDATTGCFGRGSKQKDLWTERRDSILSEPIPLTTKDRCRNLFRRLLCCGCRCFRRPLPPPPTIEDAVSRRASLLSKKKSLTPTVIPQEDPRIKLDTSLVDYTSTMKAAIPVLPLVLAYICLFFNIFLPGSGTVFSGLFCLCLGKPRFSQHDGPKPRLGSFIINTIIGAGQLFTVLFCLVGWGWSIWWGVIMIKIAKKYKKIKLLEERAVKQQEKDARHSKEGSQKRDIEKGRS